MLFTAPAPGQDAVTFFRGDEVGPRSLRLDEEGFLNILSFEQPLESIQEWLATPSGYWGALGSLTQRELWLEQELKVFAPVSDRFAVTGRVRQAVDLDSSYLFLQPEIEYKLNEKHALFSPVTLDADKGNLGGGLGWRFRDPDAGIDYFQLSWNRSNLLFEQRSRDYRDSTIRDQPDAFEVQAMGDPWGWGKTSLKVAYQKHLDILYRELGRDEEFRRFSAWILHRYDLDNGDRLFFTLDQDTAGEQVSPLVPEEAEKAFRGNRSLSRARLEYQRDLEEGGVRRLRGGFQYLYFREEENLPNVPEDIHTILRRESILYGGYRLPLDDTGKLSLETVIYLDHLENRNRYPFDPKEDGRDPPFQGKINFFFLWAVKKNVELMLSPSFELDTIGWGGGGIQLRARF